MIGCANKHRPWYTMKPVLTITQQELEVVQALEDQLDTLLGGLCERWLSAARLEVRPLSLRMRHRPPRAIQCAWRETAG